MPQRTVVCHACSAAHVFDGAVPRRSTCEKCSADLHCCLNCRFYEPGAYNDCREPTAERVVDKAAANFCDSFEPVGSPGRTQESTGSVREELEKLFRK